MGCCFDEHEKRGLSCKKESCRLWLEKSDSLNCAVVASRKGSHTLQEIGDIFGVTRMRICQIEKGIIEKVRRKFNDVIQPDRQVSQPE